jgi:hypothetical protein
MATPVEEFMAARRAFQETKNEVEQLVKKLADIRNAVVGRGWKTLSITP